MTMEDHHVLIGNASSNGCFSIVILVFLGVGLEQIELTWSVSAGVYPDISSTVSKTTSMAWSTISKSTGT